MISIIPRKRLWLTISGFFFVIAVILLVYPGMRFGIDFTGGTLIEGSFPAEVSRDAVVEQIKSFAAARGIDLGEPYVLRTEESGFIIRVKNMTNEDHIELQASLSEGFGSFEEKRFTLIGPTVGRTLKIRSFWAVGIACAIMIIFIAFAFRDIPRKLSPWKFGVVAVIALLHDVVITCGFFALLGIFTDFEVSTLFVTALLIVLGYSVNDTIVIFDRIRENVSLQQRGEDFSDVTERALHQTMMRSILTSLSTVMPLLTLFLFGPASITWFVLALLIGVSLGSYSSIFIAPSLLVLWRPKRA
jgi:preprotein translocase subunit SecF